MTSRPALPSELKREVRQRCGFGCVVCGLPLYEYEHMLGWSNVQRHVAEEITLLCDIHHRERTAGLLPIAEVKQADRNPFNRRSGTTQPYWLHYSGSDSVVNIGSNVFTPPVRSDFAAVMVDGVALVGFRFEDGHYLLNLLLFDDQNGVVLQIEDNALLQSVDVWDIELVGSRLVVRSAPRDIFIDIVFEPPNSIRIERGRLIFHGVELLVRPAFALIVNNTTLLQRNESHGMPVGLNIGENNQPIPSMIRVEGIPREGFDRAAARRWAREHLDASGDL